jgi:hypothetical protein
MTTELIPLCTATATLSDPIFVGDGPKGMRLIFEITDVVVAGERLTATMIGKAGADWITLVAGTGTLDVRVAVQTDDGAIIFVQYTGRTDISAGLDAPKYVAPTFETSDPRYTWLNNVQAVGKGFTEGNTITYEWFEVR